MPYTPADKIVSFLPPEEIEPQALAQLKNTAEMPFIFHHVAAMPDCHLGKGSTVGSVLATKGAIMPAAVGVDIGCFTGDTLVPLLDGKSYSLKELAERREVFAVYACTESGKIVAAKATARKTRIKAKLIKVVLDNGAEIRCTPDHKFMLRDGSYLEAEKLKVDESLMPLYREIAKDGFVLVQQNYSGRMQKAHWIVGQSGLLGNNMRLEADRAVIDQSFYAEFSNHRLYSHGYNHKVVSVEEIAEREDVYCLNVPEYHNFALEAGVFVHNCGMIAVRTPLNSSQLPDNLDKIRIGIERSVPLGAGAKNKNLTRSAEVRIAELNKRAQGVEYKYFSDWMHQLGSLGSGNHFIEVCLDESETVWLVLHSGSRGVGNQLAQKYIKIAQKLMAQNDIPLKDRDLAYLSEGTEEFKNYIRDLLWAQDFALLNREEMMDRALTELSKTIYKEAGHEKKLESERINCHHNFTQLENHFGENVWITRKGAIQMKLGQLGVIPGSMGTRSYIVSGLENPLSFHSAPHGAGRRMSRTKAKAQFTLKDLEAAMGDISFRHSHNLIDEIPMAYKDIDQVMNNSKDLVKIEHTLRQVVNVKGD